MAFEPVAWPPVSLGRAGFVQDVLANRRATLGATCPSTCLLAVLKYTFVNESQSAGLCPVQALPEPVLQAPTTASLSARPGRMEGGRPCHLSPVPAPSQWLCGGRPSRPTPCTRPVPSDQCQGPGRSPPPMGTVHVHPQEAPGRQGEWCATVRVFLAPMCPQHLQRPPRLAVSPVVRAKQ